MYDVLEYQFKSSLYKYGYTVKVNNINDIKVLMMEYEEGKNTTDYKYMLVTNGFAKQGDIITFFSDRWLVTSENISINDVYTKFIIRRLKFDIKFNFEGNVIPFSSAIDEGNFTISGNTIQLQEGKILLHMQENEQSKQIKKEQRFIIMDNAWKVTQKTNAEHGIYLIYAEIDIFNIDDDKENEIADRWKYESQDTYSIVINNVESTITINKTLQLDVTTTKNDVVETLPLIYTSADETVLTVDSNGLVTANKVGTASITVAIAENTSTTATITLTVEEQQASATYTVTAIDEYGATDGSAIYSTQWYKYTIHKFVGGVETTGTFTFEVDDISLATITETTDNYCVVTAEQTVKGGSIILTITDTETGEIAVEKSIEIIGW